MRRVESGEPDFLPYARHSFGEAEADAAAAVARKGRLSQGPAVAELEARLAEWCGARFAVAVSSGTAALHLSFLALDLQPGDEVIVPALTFVATANAVLLAGGTPVPADIDPGDLNLCARAVEARLTPRTRAICPVHFAGAAVDLAALSQLAAPRRIAIVEDAAHALGAGYRDPEAGWHRIGKAERSHTVCFSFHPAKSISTGEGGAVLTQSEELDRRLREIRNHGLVADPSAPALQPGSGSRLERLGLNYRLGDLPAAIGVVQISRLPDFLERRARLAARYRAGLADLPGLTLLEERPYSRSCHNLMVVRIEGAGARDRLLEALIEKRIGAAVHYPPLHQHPYYRRRFGWDAADYPQAEACGSGVLSLPLFPDLTDADCDRVIDEVGRALPRAL